MTGKPLPDLSAAGLPAGAAPTGKRALVCLFDFEQRPSRRFLKLVAEQAEGLAKKDIVVVGLHAVPATPESFKELKEANPVTFPVGFIQEKTPATKWITDIESLPWLILTDTAGKITAEGFALDELDSKLK